MRRTVASGIGKVTQAKFEPNRLYTSDIANLSEFAYYLPGQISRQKWHETLISLQMYLHWNVQNLIYIMKYRYLYSNMCLCVL